MFKIESRGHVDNDIKHNTIKINALEERVTKLEAIVAELEDEIKKLKSHD
jgi:predicted RNase H-like nuclease (RuvC/YqgF family)